MIWLAAVLLLGVFPQLTRAWGARKEYHLGTEGGLCNSLNIVDDEDFCKQAAGDLDKYYKWAIDRADYPYGCFAYGSNVYFNSYHGGSKKADVTPICIAGQQYRPVIPEEDECRDLDSDCTDISTTFCAEGNQYHGWMTKNCPKHCGVCSDSGIETREGDGQPVIPDSGKETREGDGEAVIPEDQILKNSENDCASVGYYPITDEEECKRIGEKLAPTAKIASSEHESGFPSYCYFFDGSSDDYIVYNSHPSGGNNARSFRICKPWP